MRSGRQALGARCSCYLDPSPLIGTLDTKLYGTFEIILSLTGNWSAGLISFVCCWSTYSMEVFDGKGSSAIHGLLDLSSQWSVGTPNSACPKSKYWKGLGFWNQKNLSLALYFTCYMNLGQVISNLWTFVSSTESPKVLEQGSAMVCACFRKIPPAAVWGMGRRGETRGSSEAAE